MQIFRDAADFDKCMSLLISSSSRSKCSVHSHVLMDNHFHLLVTPVDKDGPADFMQSFASAYALYYNKRYERTGTLWEGRYDSFVVGSDRYFFNCTRYIEMNPVRALMVAHPAEYLHSSYLCNAFGIPNPLVASHPLYESLGGHSEERHSAYRQLFTHHLDDQACDEVRNATRTGKTLGGNDPET